MKKFGSIFGLFIFSFMVGYGIILHSSVWGPVNRDPAAIRQVYDFSNLKGADLTEAMKKRLLFGASVVHKDASIGVELGHFAMAKITGEKTLACQEFDNIVLRFEADGVAVSGERPVMEVEGGCEFSADMTTINPMMIPVAQILAEKPMDGEIQYRESNHLTLRFHGMPEEWPKRWMLTSIRLSNKPQQKELLIGSDEVSQILGHPFMVSFE